MVEWSLGIKKLHFLRIITMQKLDFSITKLWRSQFEVMFFFIKRGYYIVPSPSSALCEAFKESGASGKSRSCGGWYSALLAFIFWIFLKVSNLLWPFSIHHTELESFLRQIGHWPVSVGPKTYKGLFELV